MLAGLDAVRAGTSLDTALRELVDREHGGVRLFAPAFSSPSATAGGGDAPVGYISSYPPGIRENGGQYTHAAVDVYKRQLLFSPAYARADSRVTMEQKEGII